MSIVSQFYDHLADDYHLIASGWDEEVRRQGGLLRALLTERFNVRPGEKVLDCSCGIGTQAIGLALEGYQVTGSDISEKEIERAKVESKRLGAKLDFHVADFTTTADADNQKFDAVISFDNAIAHLRDVEQLELAFHCMRQKLKKGGVLLISVRDYDQLREAKPSGTLPRMIVDQYGKRVYFQTWDWDEAGESYSVNLFVLRDHGQSWQGAPLETKMRAFTAEEVLRSLRNAGFSDAHCLTTAESKYYQPVFAARVG